MIPMQWYANVKLPYYGWFGETFSTKPEARAFIARMYRSARKPGGGRIGRPSYAGRSYIIKARPLTLDDC